MSVAQRLEHWTVAPGVEGSNPFTHPICKNREASIEIGILNSSSSFLVFGNGPLAQLVEQLTLNQRVRSSSLRRPTKLYSDYIALMPRASMLCSHECGEVIPSVSSDLSNGEKSFGYAMLPDIYLWPRGGHRLNFA